jgi:hypothetical protein
LEGRDDLTWTQCQSHPPPLQNPCPPPKKTNRSLWNSTVHNFLRLHLMQLCKRLRLHIHVSHTIVFFVSAVAHELPIMVSATVARRTFHVRVICRIFNRHLHTTPSPTDLLLLLLLLLHPVQILFRSWQLYGGAQCLFGAGFWAMMVQMPLAAVTPLIVPKTKTGAMFGNAFFWIVFCGVIQPLAVRLLCLFVYRFRQTCRGTTNR